MFKLRGTKEMQPFDTANLNSWQPARMTVHLFFFLFSLLVSFCCHFYCDDRIHSKYVSIFPLRFCIGWHVWLAQIDRSNDMHIVKLDKMTGDCLAIAFAYPVPWIFNGCVCVFPLFVGFCSCVFDFLLMLCALIHIPQAGKKTCIFHKMVVIRVSFSMQCYIWIWGVFFPWSYLCPTLALSPLLWLPLIILLAAALVTVCVSYFAFYSIWALGKCGCELGKLYGQT